MIAIPNINKFEGSIPSGHDLVVYERGTSPYRDGFVLYGFDEVSSYRSFGIKNPVFCFLPNSVPDELLMAD